MGSIDLGYFLDMWPACLMIKIWEYSYHVHHFPPPDPSSCNCSTYLDMCIDALREVYDNENYIYFDSAIYKFQFYRKKCICLMSTKNERYKEQIVEGILRGERFACRSAMAEKIIYHRETKLIECVCSYKGHISFYHKCEKIIFCYCSDDCNVCKKKHKRTDDHCHLICQTCHDQLQSILKKEG